MLEEYRFELGDSGLKIDAPSDDVTTIIESMNLNNKTRKILMFELMGLAFTDDYFDQTEKDLLIEIQNIIGISDDEITILGKYVNDILKLYSEIGDYINE